MQASSASSSDLPIPIMASIAPEASQPARITFSSNTSRVPCLVPGMKAWISAAGSNLGGHRLVPLLFGEGVEGRAVDLAGKDDAVIADPDLDDVGHAIGSAGLDFTFADLARGVGDVDRVFTHALAEAFQAGRRAARFDDGRREVEVLAEGFCHDRGIGQHRRGPGDLHLIARGGSACGHSDDRQGRGGQFRVQHEISPEWLRSPHATSSGAYARAAMLLRQFCNGFMTAPFPTG